MIGVRTVPNVLVNSTIVSVPAEVASFAQRRVPVFAKQ